MTTRRPDYDAELERCWRQDRTQWAALVLARVIEDGADVLREIAGSVNEIAQDIHAIRDKYVTKAKLSSIRIRFGGNMQGPVTLTSGQSTTATVLYFDQTGAPMPSTFVPPAVTFSIDNSGVASSTPGSDGQSDAVAYVTAGVANLTASVTSAEGLALSDTETVTCSPIVVPPPVLSSVKVDFSTPTP